jgi:hypothetical protein
VCAEDGEAEGLEAGVQLAAGRRTERVEIEGEWKAMAVRTGRKRRGATGEGGVAWDCQM